MELNNKQFKIKGDDSIYTIHEKEGKIKISWTVDVEYDKEEAEKHINSGKWKFI